MAKYIVQHRRGTAEQWASQDTIIPKEGELVIEIDEINSLHKLKIGDGIHTYAELAYLQAGDEIVTQVLTQAKPRVVTVTLTDSWIQTAEGKYSQVVELGDITKYSRLDLQPDADMLAEFKQLGLVFVTENNGGTITIYSVGNMPLKSYTMQATIIETECSGQDTSVIGIPVGTPVPQSDWAQTDETKADYIKNKPIVEQTYSAESTNAQSGIAVAEAIANMVDSAPETLDTLNELAAALGDDPNFATTVAEQIGKKADKTDIEDVVRYTTQTLTEEQQAQVRANIGAGASSFSGDYNDLTNKPDIPDSLSDLTEDDTHRVVTDAEKETWNAKSEFSGSYNDLTDKPEGIATETYVDDSINNLTIKGNESSSIVIIDDISPMEHILDVKVSGDDLNGVTVTKCGYNLFDLSYLDKTYTSHYNAYGGTDKLIDIRSLRSKYLCYQRQVDFSNTIEDTATFSLKVMMFDADMNLVKQQFSANNITKSSQSMICRMNFLVVPTAVYIGFCVSVFFDGTNAPQPGSTISVSNSMVTFQNLNVKHYESYCGETYTPDADGNVVGVTSQYPTTIIFTNNRNFVVDVGYNRDSAATYGLASESNPGLMSIEHYNKLENIGDGVCSIGQSGDGEHSEIFNDYENNIAQSPYSSASGHNNLAGLKGYYYYSIGNNNSEILLTKTQGIAPTEPFKIPYKEGDVISMVNGSKYPNCATIVCVTDNCIEISNNTPLPFNSMVEMDPSDYAMDDFSIWVEAKPTEGEVPLGYYAHSEGENTKALERAAHSEGRQTLAYGQYSHVEGRKTKASYASHAEGYNSHASGFYSHAQNRDTIASGNDSSAEGLGTTASGQASHAQNVCTEASGYGSTACGNLTNARGEFSFATGNQTNADGKNSFTAGVATHADADNSFAIGYYTIAGSRYQFVRGRFNEIDTEGKYIDIVGNGSGEDTRSNAYTLTEAGEGWFKRSITTTDAFVNNYLKAGAIQTNTLQIGGKNSHGYLTTTTADVNGNLTVAGKTISNEYTGNTINLAGSMVIGHNSSAHQSCIAAGSYCHAGNSDGDIRYAVALGYNNNALFGGSSAIGQGLTTGRASQHVIGEYNKVDSESLLVLGNGSDINHRSNAFTVGKSGEAWFAGDVTVGSDNKKLATEEYVDSMSGGNSSIVQLNYTINVEDFQNFTKHPSGTKGYYKTVSIEGLLDTDKLVSINIDLDKYSGSGIVHEQFAKMCPQLTYIPLHSTGSACLHSLEDPSSFTAEMTLIITVLR